MHNDLNLAAYLNTENTSINVYCLKQRGVTWRKYHWISDIDVDCKDESDVDFETLEDIQHWE